MTLRSVAVTGVALSALGTLLATSLATSATASPPTTRHHEQSTAHVLLISVDGLHAADAAWYIAHHPHSSLARLSAKSTTYTQARTPFPSDSFPGLLGQVTGGNPKTTGIWYDVSYNPTLLPPGTTACAGVAPGTTVAFDESLDKTTTSLDAGQGLPGLPGSILGMTGSPTSLINPAALPVDPAGCKPVYPHNYLRVNTIFEVARAHGLRTAWSDKHPAYEILNGPSGGGVQDLFTPEINSSTDPANPDGDDWTKNNAKTQQYDHYKIQSVLNELAGKDHSGTTKVGVPAILGLNLQSVSTAEKLPLSDGLPGGYLADGVTPGPVLSGALDFVDRQLDLLLDAIAAQHLTGSTAVILSAKHGQSPTQGSALTRIDDGAILDALNAAWTAKTGAGPLVVGSLNDDGMLLWFSDHGPRAQLFARQFLLAYHGDGTAADGSAKATAIDGSPKTFSSAGLSKVLVGRQVLRFTGAAASDVRVPDLIGVVQHGVVYTGGKKKIAEHGGDDVQDRAVPLIVSIPQGDHGQNSKPVETTQIAPTILALLHLDPRELQAVQIEHTKALDIR